MSTPSTGDSHRLEQAEQVLLAVAPRLGRVDEVKHDVDLVERRRAPCCIMAAFILWCGRCTPGRSKSTAWPRSVVEDADDPVAGGLRSGRDDGHLLADQGVEQRALARVRPPDQCDRPRVRLGRHCVTRARRPAPVHPAHARDAPHSPSVRNAGAGPSRLGPLWAALAPARRDADDPPPVHLIHREVSGRGRGPRPSLPASGHCAVAREHQATDGVNVVLADARRRRARSRTSIPARP